MVLVSHSRLFIKHLTLRTGGKCGSVFINRVFKTWLRDHILGKFTVNFEDKETNAYEVLEPNSPGRISLSGTEHKRMRKVMAKFIDLKESFTGTEDHMKISLPPPLDSLTIQGRVIKGDVLISS
jgi:hypothetical protein